jgi:hypothetical protein
VIKRISQDVSSQEDDDMLTMMDPNNMFIRWSSIDSIISGGSDLSGMESGFTCSDGLAPSSASCPKAEHDQDCSSCVDGRSAHGGLRNGGFDLNPDTSTGPLEYPLLGR